MAQFYGMQPLNSPDDWEDIVGAGKWKGGYSAQELAFAWQGAGGIPAPIRDAFSSSGNDALRDLTLGMALVEKPVFLDTQKAPSMTDIMAYAQNAAGETVVLAVEGKANEPFGLPVRAWVRGSQLNPAPDAAPRPTRLRRLRYLADRLGIKIDADSGLYYQLLHRTVSALSEADLHGAAAAVLLIHSFGSEDSINWAAYQDFIGALGGSAQAKGVATGPLRKTDMPLYAMWWQSPARNGNGQIGT